MDQRSGICPDSRMEVGHTLSSDQSTDYSLLRDHSSRSSRDIFFFFFVFHFCCSDCSQIYRQGDASICPSQFHRSRSAGSDSHRHRLRRSEERRSQVSEHVQSIISRDLLARFTQNLLEAKAIGIRKGVLIGLCQAFVQMSIYTVFSITFWCRSTSRIDRFTPSDL